MEFYDVELKKDNDPISEPNGGGSRFAKFLRRFVKKDPHAAIRNLLCSRCKESLNDNYLEWVKQVRLETSGSWPLCWQCNVHVGKYRQFCQLVAMLFSSPETDN